ncbi:MAG: TrmH family RNA methyltransferase, partial [Mucinivorans sp.]
MLKIKNSELGRITAQQYASMEKMPVVVVLDNVRSAQNVGAFFRTGDAFGLGEVVLSGITGTPPSKEIHKSALGAEFSVPWRYFDSTT